MHPDNPRYEALEPEQVQPYGTFGIIYEDLVEALRHDLMIRRTGPTPVYPFDMTGGSIARNPLISLVLLKRLSNGPCSSSLSRSKKSAVCRPRGPLDGWADRS